MPNKKLKNNPLPNNIKSGVENLSGILMDDVTVHFNSDKPVQLNALAFAEGTAIHLAPGQEKHLPHEAWHVVQQKQGRVKPTVAVKAESVINDDAGLENEADAMGLKSIKNKMPG
jgi:D-lyxose ketol-isomerase